MKGQLERRRKTVTVVVEIDLPMKVEQVEHLSAAIGSREDPPEGLLVHVVTDKNGMAHVVDVWDSREAFERFTKERLLPGIEQAMGSSGADHPDMPEPSIVEAFDLVRGR
jgi:hypothetical protein